jgi:hypothetical protein
VQLKPNSELFDSGSVSHVPLVATGPFHAPLAVQLLAFLVLQVSVELAPVPTVVGDALRVIVGAG